MRTILVSAYACEPLKGSEQGVGWNWVLQLAKNNIVHVITRANNQEVIAAHIPGHLADNIHFHYYDTHNLIKGFKNKAKGLYFYYFFWQLGIVPLVRKLSKKYDFNYAMHLTMGSIWMPTFLPFFKIPFIWGPVGGGESEPKEFNKNLPIKQMLLQYVRHIMSKLSWLHPTVMVPGMKSKVILVRTKNTKNSIPGFLRKKVKVILETAMNEIPVAAPDRDKNTESNTIKCIVTGRLMPSKNIITAVIALSYIPHSTAIEFSIIGSGPNRAALEQEIIKTGQQNRIRIISEIPREQVLEQLRKSDIFLFPSLREGGSWALMEAMATGLPVICLNWTGMEIITDGTCAVQLEVTNPDQMPKDLAKAITYLIENPEIRRSMGEAGRNRIKERFNWEAKGEFMEQLFTDLDNRSKK